jgi:hypothetical protein
MQVGLARGRARSVVGGTRCSWSRSAGPSLLGRYPGAPYWDGIPVQSGQLSRWQSIGGVLVTVAAVIAEGVQAWFAIVDHTAFIGLMLPH